MESRKSTQCGLEPTENYLNPKPLDNGNSDRLYELQITVEGDCSHEIKRHLLLGRVMTNLDSILKIRDMTLPTKIHVVKDMVFPVVMFGCAVWAIKKSEYQRIDAFELWC